MVDGKERRAELPLVSVITPVLNGAGTIERCLDSVRDQDYPRVDHIVIDGGSRDRTAAILKSREAELAYWRSEPDTAAAVAFNRGLRAARGDVIGFLNADDWYEPDAVSRAVAALEAADADFTYGAVAVHGRSGELGVLRPLPAERWARECLYQMPVPHITVFIRREALARIGVFDERFSNTSDHDQFIRLLESGCRGVPVEGVMGHIRTGGATDGLKALRESWSIAKRHGVPAGRRAWRFGRHLAVYLLRRPARQVLGELGTARLLARLGSRHASG